MADDAIQNSNLDRIKSATATILAWWIPLTLFVLAMIGFVVIWYMKRGDRMREIEERYAGPRARAALLAEQLAQGALGEVRRVDIQRRDVNGVKGPIHTYWTNEPLSRFNFPRRER